MDEWKNHVLAGQQDCPVAVSDNPLTSSSYSQRWITIDVDKTDKGVDYGMDKAELADSKRL